MKSKSICFCIRGRSRKSKENEGAEDSEKLSDAKPPHKGKVKGHSGSPTPGDDGDGGNVHGGSTIASNDAGVAAAVVTAAHLAVLSANEGQDGSGHGGDSGGHAGG